MPIDTVAQGRKPARPHASAASKGESAQNRGLCRRVRAHVRTTLWLLIVAIVLIVFVVHYRFILVHFSSGGYLLDSAWFAHLLSTGDPMLTNPSAVGQYSYYHHHLAPFLALFSSVAAALSIGPFSSLALHQAVMFSLLLLSLLIAAMRGTRGADAGILVLVCILIGCTGNMVLQTASYPHFEIATLALCATGVVLLRENKTGWAALPFALAVLVREDGGLFVALFLLGDLLLRSQRLPPVQELVRNGRLLGACVTGLAALAMFWLKGTYFTDFPTFSSNFSGDGWSHLNPTWLAQRLVSSLSQVQILWTILALVVLAAFSWRYLIHAILVLPLIVAQLLAVRDVIGQFELYYIVPWLVIWIGIFLTATWRARIRLIGFREKLALVVLSSVLGTTPLMVVVGIPSAGWVLEQALMGETIDLETLSEDLSAHLDSTTGRVCLSIGAVALIPDHIAPDQLVSSQSDLSGCDRLYLFVGDMGHTNLRRQAEGSGFIAVSAIAPRIEVFSSGAIQ